MKEPVTISFVGTEEIKVQLKQWALQEDRSVSWIVRQILEAESRRRAAQEETKSRKKEN